MVTPHVVTGEARADSGGSAKAEAALASGTVPTYLCHTHRGALTPAQRLELARRITAVHSEVTATPRSFAQVLFRETDLDSHFVGGRAADPRSVWVHGHIRAGRTAEVRRRVVLGIRDHVVAVSGVPEHFVWAYLSELEPSDMVEFGQVLPAPGGERAWREGLPAAARRQLDDLDT